MTEARLGAVVYAKDLAQVVAFYAGVADLDVVASADDHAVLESSGVDLVIVRIPDAIAATFTIADPPERREDTAVKLVVPVADLAVARAHAARLGGVIDPPAAEWRFRGSVVCDGHDPEGNVIQLRQPIA